jgi:hypothetical protein
MPMRSFCMTLLHNTPPEQITPYSMVRNCRGLSSNQAKIFGKE